MKQQWSFMLHLPYPRCGKCGGPVPTEGTGFLPYEVKAAFSLLHLRWTYLRYIVGVFRSLSPRIECGRFKGNLYYVVTNLYKAVQMYTNRPTGVQYITCTHIYHKRVHTIIFNTNFIQIIVGEQPRVCIRYTCTM